MTDESLPVSAGIVVQPNYSEACIESCPQLHRCVNSALIRLAIGSDELRPLLDRAIQTAQESALLPNVCEVGPVTVSGGTTRPGGTPVRLARLQASTFWGMDPWNHPVATVCQMDREKLIHGERLNAPWESDDRNTGLFRGELKTEFYQDPH